jgi:hypothetical protein
MGFAGDRSSKLGGTDHEICHGRGSSRFVVHIGICAAGAWHRYHRAFGKPISPVDAEHDKRPERESFHNQ